MSVEAYKSIKIYELHQMGGITCKNVAERMHRLYNIEVVGLRNA